jgi:acetylornithine deacetylase/succinyl-diaminopimelate desuccinylase-like protein
MDPRSAVVEAVDASEAGLHSLLRDLIAFRTESQAKEADHFPAEARGCIAYLSDFLSGLGFELDGWDVGPSATFAAHPLLIARRPGAGGGRSLAFNAHVDVVPVGDPSAWSQEPRASTRW